MYKFDLNRESGGEVVAWCGENCRSPITLRQEKVTVVRRDLDGDDTIVAGVHPDVDGLTVKEIRRRLRAGELSPPFFSMIAPAIVA